jgi:hypothetical protein
MKSALIDLEKLSSKDPRVKYGFAKELLGIGANNPTLLYAYLGYWEEMCRSNNSFLRWTAIDIIGYLYAVDRDNKTDRLITNLNICP